MLEANDCVIDEFLILSTNIERSIPMGKGCALLRSHYSRWCTKLGWPFICAYPTKCASDRDLWTIEADLITMHNHNLITLSDRARRDTEERMMIYSKPTKYAQKFYAKHGFALWINAGFHSHCSYIDGQHAVTLCRELKNILKWGIVSNGIAEKSHE